jgi:hypothetical protein
MSVPDNWDDELVDFARPAVALDCCCAICLDPRDRPDDMALLLPCEHRCDADCIEQWRARQPDLLATCPLCRSPIDRVSFRAFLFLRLDFWWFVVMVVILDLD